MDIPNPLLAKATISKDRALAPPSLSSVAAPPEKPRKRVSAKTERLIGELGLRYRPSAQEDLEAHAATLALLAADVSDIPPDILEEAIQRHISISHFMPKASELIALSQSILKARGGKRDPASVQRLHDLAASLNNSRFVKGHGWTYFVGRDEDGISFLDRRDGSPPESDPAKVILAEFGLGSRYPSNRA